MKDHGGPAQLCGSNAKEPKGYSYFKYSKSSGRGGEIRTHDPLYPKQVRYQTAPRPDTAASLGNWIGNEKLFSLAGEGFFILG